MSAGAPSALSPKFELPAISVLPESFPDSRGALSAQTGAAAIRTAPQNSKPSLTFMSFLLASVRPQKPFPALQILLAVETGVCAIVNTSYSPDASHNQSILRLVRLKHNTYFTVWSLPLFRYGPPSNWRIPKGSR